MRKVWMVAIALIALGLVSFEGARRWRERAQAQPSNLSIRREGESMAHKAVADASRDTTARMRSADCDPSRWVRAFAVAASENARRRMLAPDARDALIATFLFKRMSSVGGPDEAAADREADAAMATALRLGEDDALVQWVAVNGCANTAAACDRDRALARLQRLQPDNAAVWLAGLKRAVERKDDPATQEAWLQRAAAADHYRTSYSELGRLMYAVVQEMLPLRAPACAQAAFAAQSQVPDTSDRLAGVVAMKIAVAYSLPPVEPIAEMCREPSPSRRKTCIAVLAQLADGSEMVDRTIGLHLGMPLVADTPDSAVWRERLRQLNWLRQHYGVQDGQPEPADWSRRLIEQGEIPAMQAWLVERGLRPTPPPGWQLEDPGSAPRSRPAAGPSEPAP